MDIDIRPFSISIPQRDLDDLRYRLTNARWPAPLPGAEWSRGVPVAYLRELVEYWRNDYDWRITESRLNAWPQFTTDIDGQTIHFAHVRSADPDAIPLLLTHSWPNSIVEFLDVVGPLVDPRAHGRADAQAFHLVVPSLPGFGFSPFPEPADPRPWSIERVARTWAVLMDRLGYDRYAAHGNDAGALVSPALALAAPDHLIAVHITAGLGLPFGDPTALAELTDQERAQFEELAAAFSNGSGYAEYLAKRPQTLSYGLTDSPIAQLAFLVERFKEFDGWARAGTHEPITRDRILANATLYWLTGTAGSSSWTYYEGAAGMPIDQATVPTGVSHGGPGIRRFAERTNDIRHWSDHTSGSHMVAMATPDVLVDDISSFLAVLRRSAER